MQNENKEKYQECKYINIPLNYTLLIILTGLYGGKTLFTLSINQKYKTANLIPSGEICWQKNNYCSYQKQSGGINSREKRLFHKHLSFMYVCVCKIYI